MRMGTERASHKVVLWPLLTTLMSLMVNFNCFSDLELKPVGILEVKLVQAKELTNKDLIGKSDPYAVLYIRPLRDRMKTSKIIVSYLTSLNFVLSFAFWIYYEFRWFLL